MSELVSELEFSVPPTAVLYEDRASVETLNEKTGEAGDQSCDPWIGSSACYPPYKTAAKEANRISQTLFPFVKMKVYPFSFAFEKR